MKQSGKKVLQIEGRTDRQTSRAEFIGQPVQ